MMPHLMNMVRSQCRVLESRGLGVGRCASTVRLSAKPGTDGVALREALKSWIDDAVGRPGLAGAHLLRHEQPHIPMLPVLNGCEASHSVMS